MNLRASGNRRIGVIAGRLVRGVGRCLHLLLGGAMPACRFEPTCSVYAQDALTEHGFRGVFLVLGRLARCHPWGGQGLDPVPGTNKRILNHGQ